MPANSPNIDSAKDNSELFFPTAFRQSNCDHLFSILAIRASFMSDRSKAKISEQNSSEQDNFSFRWEMVNGQINTFKEFSLYLLLKI